MTYAYICYLVLSFLFISSMAGRANFKNCGKSQVNYIALTGCDSRHTDCPFPRGSEIEFNVSFSIDRNTTKADLLLEYQLPLFNTRVPVPLPDSNGCRRLSGGCPLRTGKIYHFSYKMKVPRHSPRMRGTLFASLIGDKGQVLSCVKFTGKVV